MLVYINSVANLLSMFVNVCSTYPAQSVHICPVQEKLNQALKQLEEKDQKAAQLQKAVDDVVQKITEQDGRMWEMKKELDETKDLLSWYEKEPHKAAGLKKCNRCKRFTWSHSEKACLNYQCVLNIKIVALKQTQTGEEAENGESNVKFEEVETVDTTLQQQQEHEERMRRWREEQDALKAANQTEAGEVEDNEEPAQKRPRHQLIGAAVTHFMSYHVASHWIQSSCCCCC